MSTIIWNDPCETYKTKLGIVYRTAVGLSPEQYGIRPAIRGNGMFIDTVESGNWNSYGIYGVTGSEYVEFGKNFQDALIPASGYEDVWISYLWKVSRVPGNAAMQPSVPIFQVSACRGWTAGWWGQGEVSRGWEIRLHWYQEAGEGWSKGDIRAIGRANSQLGISIMAPVFDLKLGNAEPGPPHRVVYRTYYTNPLAGIQVKEIYLDDRLVLSPQAWLNGLAEFGLIYNLGRGLRGDNPYAWSAIWPCYAGWEVDDVIVWTGEYYDYPWKGPVAGQIPMPWWLVSIAGGSIGVAAGRKERYVT